MYLDKRKTQVLRKIISRLYTEPFDESLVLATAKASCDLTDAHYFGFCLLPRGSRSPFRFIANNPPEFNPVYLSVVEKDFLLESMVNSGGEYVMRRDASWDMPSHEEFITTVQSARPISDVVYEPCSVGGILSGYFGVARAGLDSPFYSDSDIEAFRFLSWFANDAFKRSLLPPPLDEDLAFLDYHGHIVDAGARIRAAFAELFGRGPALRYGSALYEVFQKRYRNYLHGPFRPGMEKLVLFAQDRRYSFSFSKLRPRGLELREDGLPYASVRLLGQAEERSSADPLDLTALSRRYALTPRELEVILGIYRGKMNKEIAAQLGVDESTVKRHTHNIYEKTGFRSRVELVLGLFGEE